MMKQKNSRFSAWVLNILFVLHVLLLFFLIFESNLSIPPFLQSFGRMHPMLLHFPIVLIFLVLIFGIWKNQKPFDNDFNRFFNFILSLTSMVAVCTVLMGFFLSQEEYSSITYHKWTGITVSFITYGMMLLWTYKPEWQKAFFSLLGVNILLVIVSSHLGASITHGENFVLEPLLGKPPVQAVNIETDSAFESVIMPIFEDKCVSCHNEKKRKGELVLTSVEAIKAGGENGNLFDTASPNEGLLLHHLILPPEEDGHMPPIEKKQLTSDEFNLIQAWIAEGNDFNRSLANYDESSVFRQLGLQQLSISTEKIYAFFPADPATIEELSTENRIILPLSEESPALAVNFYDSGVFSSKMIEELSPIKEQLISLNLSNMPLEDSDIESITIFQNLESLNLNFTPITGSTLSKLKTLKSLSKLSLVGTSIDLKKAQQLRSIKSLSEVYVWNTAIPEEEISTLNSQQKVRFYGGYQDDGVPIAIVAPQVEFPKENIIFEDKPILLKHPIKEVTIRYTTDGSEPDSVSSPIYENGIPTESFTHIRAKAFKEGWYGSNSVQFSLFKSTFAADSAQLLSMPNEKYKGQLAKGLIDQKKGNYANFSEKGWLGYNDTPFEALIFFEKNPSLKTMTLSMYRRLGAYIFPPTSIEVWAGSDENNLTLLEKRIPEQATKETGNGLAMLSYTFQLKNPSHKVFKIRATPITSLPTWHPGAGNKGWIFIDEVFFN